MTGPQTPAAPQSAPGAQAPEEPKARPRVDWKALLPVAVALAIALIPAPAGLPPHAWYFFAIFAGVIVGLMVEPLPGPAISLLGVTLATVLAPWVLYGPADLARPGFNPANAGLAWALSGFANPTVWLIFGAFMFALGYEKTGLGRRVALLLVRAMGRRTLTLGYAVTVGGHAPRPVHPVDHGPERRHHLPGGPQPAATVRLQAERPVGAQDRLVPDVDGAGRHLHQQLDVPHRHGAQPAGGGDREEDREPRHQLDGLADGVRAGGDPAARHAAAPRLRPLSADDQGRERGARLGRAGAEDDGRALPARDHPGQSWCCWRWRCGSSAATT